MSTFLAVLKWLGEHAMLIAAVVYLTPLLYVCVRQSIYDRRDERQKRARAQQQL